MPPLSYIVGSSGGATEGGLFVCLHALLKEFDLPRPKHSPESSMSYDVFEAANKASLTRHG